MPYNNPYISPKKRLAYANAYNDTLSGNNQEHPDYTKGELKAHKKGTKDAQYDQNNRM
jgi:hypothetical protein